MSTPKRHHFIPQMLLKGFCDKDGWLHWTSLNGKDTTIRRSRPGALFLQKHLYSTVSASGVKDADMERELSVLETKAAEVINAILVQTRAGLCPNLTPEQKRIWYLFFYMQTLRTPEWQQATISDSFIMQELDMILDQIHQEFPNRRDEINEFNSTDARARTLLNVRVDVLRQPSILTMPVLERRGISVLRITKPNKGFIIGSNPFGRFSFQGHSQLTHPQVEMWLPIASDVAVGVGQGDGDISLHLLDTDQPIRRLNTLIAGQSSIIAAASATLIRSIANQR